jgi:hypothetical protein
MNWLFRGFSLFFLAFSCLGLFAFASGIMKGESEPDGVKILIACVLLLVGLGMTTHRFLSRLAFSSEGVEQISFLGRKNLPFASIRGRREHVVRGGNPGGSTRYLRVEPNETTPRSNLGKSCMHLTMRSGRGSTRFPISMLATWKNTRARISGWSDPVILFQQAVSVENNPLQVCLWAGSQEMSGPGT